jgi:hypothetical protein
MDRVILRMNENSSSASARNHRRTVGTATPDIPIRGFRRSYPGGTLLAGCPFRSKSVSQAMRILFYYKLGLGLSRQPSPFIPGTDYGSYIIPDHDYVHPGQASWLDRLSLLLLLPFPSHIKAITG